MANKELTLKQKRFCEEYVLDWNGSRSARAAGYSEKTSKEIASNLLTKINIQEYIDHIQKDLAKLAGISALSNITELKNILTTKDEQTKDKIKAIEVINKMLDFNSAEKSEVKIEAPLSKEERSIRIAELLEQAKQRKSSE